MISIMDVIRIYQTLIPPNLGRNHFRYTCKIPRFPSCHRNLGRERRPQHDRQRDGGGVVEFAPLHAAHLVTTLSFIQLWAHSNVIDMCLPIHRHRNLGRECQPQHDGQQL